MSEAEDRIRDYLAFWARNAAEVKASFAENDNCDPPCEFDDDLDIICAEYRPIPPHILRASDIEAVLLELTEWRQGAV